VALTLRFKVEDAARFAAQLTEVGGGKVPCEVLREEYAAL